MLRCVSGVGVSRPGLALWAGRPAPCARLLLPLSQQGQDIRTNTQQSGLLLYGRPLQPNAYKRTSTLRTSARWPPLSQPVRSKQTAHALCQGFLCYGLFGGRLLSTLAMHSLAAVCVCGCLAILVVIPMPMPRLLPCRTSPQLSSAGLRVKYRSLARHPSTGT